MMQTKWSAWRSGIVAWSRRRWKVWAIAGAAVVLLVGASLLVSMPIKPSSGAVSDAAGGGSASSSSSFSASSAPSTTAGASTAATDGPAASGLSAGTTTAQGAASTGVESASTALQPVTGAKSALGAATNGPTNGSGYSTASASSQSGIALPTDRLVIETAGLDLTVSDVTKVANQVSDITVGDGGFVETMQQSTNSQGEDFESVTVRIPETQFQAALKAVKSLGKVNTFSQSGQDVTSQHDNLQQQISELQGEAQAYTRLFDKATTMADMLQIQQSLTQVNSQLSDLNNQLHQLNHTVQFATLNISLHGAAVAAPKKTVPTPFYAPLADSIRLMERIGIGLSKVISWILPWALLAGLFYGGARLWRRSRGQHGPGK